MTSREYFNIGSVFTISQAQREMPSWFCLVPPWLGVEFSFHGFIPTYGTSTSDGSTEVWDCCKGSWTQTMDDRERLHRWTAQCWVSIWWHQLIYPLPLGQVLPFSSVHLLLPPAPIMFSFHKQEENSSARVSFCANGSPGSLFLLLCCPAIEVGR